MTPKQHTQRITNASAPGVINTVDDTGTIATVQLQVGYQEVMDKKPLLQQFGFSSVPPVSSDGFAIFIGGDRSNGVVIATNDQKTRPTGRQPGAVTIYDGFGNRIDLSQDGGIVVTGNGSQPVTIDGGGLPVRVTNGNLHVDGEVVAGFGGPDQVTLQGHRHGVGTAAAGTVVPTPGT